MWERIHRGDSSSPGWPGFQIIVPSSYTTVTSPTPTLLISTILAVLITYEISGQGAAFVRLMSLIVTPFDLNKNQNSVIYCPHRCERLRGSTSALIERWSSRVFGVNRLLSPEKCLMFNGAKIGWQRPRSINFYHYIKLWLKSQTTKIWYRRSLFNMPNGWWEKIQYRTYGDGGVNLADIYQWLSPYYGRWLECYYVYLFRMMNSLLYIP